MAINSESIKTAIEMEEKGYKYYSENAKNTENEISRRVLESLAEQELDHRKRFKELSAKSKEFSSELEAEDFEEKIKEFFTAAGKEEKKSWKEEEKEVYEKALEMEKKTYRLYSDMLDQTDDKNEKKLLKAIMNEENQHEESIQNILYYLTDHDWWLADEESKTWNWMNI